MEEWEDEWVPPGWDEGMEADFVVMCVGDGLVADGATFLATMPRTEAGDREAGVAIAAVDRCWPEAAGLLRAVRRDERIAGMVDATRRPALVLAVVTFLAGVWWGRWLALIPASAAYLLGRELAFRLRLGRTIDEARAPERLLLDLELYRGGGLSVTLLGAVLLTIVCGTLAVAATIANYHAPERSIATTIFAVGITLVAAIGPLAAAGRNRLLRSGLWDVPPAMAAEGAERRRVRERPDPGPAPAVAAGPPPVLRIPRPRLGRDAFFVVLWAIPGWPWLISGDRTLTAAGAGCALGAIATAARVIRTEVVLDADGVAARGIVRTRRWTWPRIQRIEDGVPELALVDDRGRHRTLVSPSWLPYDDGGMAALARSATAHASAPTFVRSKSHVPTTIGLLLPAALSALLAVAFLGSRFDRAVDKATIPAGMPYTVVVTATRRTATVPCPSVVSWVRDPTPAICGPGVSGMAVGGAVTTGSAALLAALWWRSWRRHRNNLHGG